MRRLIVAGLMAASFAITTALPGLAVGTTHIAVEDFLFSPKTKTVPVAATLPFAWDNGGGFPHTATSDVNGFFNTGQISPSSTGMDSLFGAGTYPYHCDNHSSMHGTIKARPTASAATIGTGETVTITFGVAVQKGFSFDLQRRRNGGAWIAMRTETALSTATFTPSQPGIYDFRARTHNVLAKISGWSPMRTVTVT